MTHSRTDGYNGSTMTRYDGHDARTDVFYDLAVRAALNWGAWYMAFWMLDRCIQWVSAHITSHWPPLARALLVVPIGIAAWYAKGWSIACLARRRPSPESEEASAGAVFTMWAQCVLVSLVAATAGYAHIAWPMFIAITVGCIAAIGVAYADADEHSG